MIDTNKDFAFASGGILWKVFDRGKFEAQTLRFKLSIVIGLMLACWLPLALLSLYRFGAHSFYLLFVHDIATHVRFLFVLPILIFARRSFNKSFNNMLGYLHETRIIDQDNTSALDKVLRWLLKWRNSNIVDAVLLILVYSAFFYQENNLVNSVSSYAPWHSYKDNLTIAGWWYVLFSLPILQLLLFRWLYTILLWIMFLWKISRIKLHLSALHPDGMGGLGFMKYTQISFFPVALAIASLAAGMTNNSMIFSGTSIMEYKVLIVSVLVFVLLLFILPLLIFLPLLASIKRKFFFQYGLESWPIARQYEKELKDYLETGEEKPDASWHVDLIGSFEKVSNMKIVLIDRSTLVAFVAAVVLPFLPVFAQQLPLKDLFFSLIGKVLG
jgi:hypothetical protein